MNQWSEEGNYAMAAEDAQMAAEYARLSSPLDNTMDSLGGALERLTRCVESCEERWARFRTPQDPPQLAAVDKMTRETRSAFVERLISFVDDTDSATRRLTQLLDSLDV